MIKALSLFACSGIGELRLQENNIKTVVANELIEERCELYSYNHPSVKMIRGSISDPEIKEKIISESIANGVEYIQATPPCQGFSSAGSMDPTDPRNFLIMDTVEVIRKVKPKWILIENVPNFAKHSLFLNGDSINTIDYLKATLSDYNVDCKVLNTVDYGIAQSRKRAIILMSRKDVKQLVYPNPYKKKITLKEAIGHLPSLESGRTSIIEYHYALNHNNNHILWMKHTPTGKTAKENFKYYPQVDGRPIKSFPNTYKRMSWDKPAPTITKNNGVISSQNTVHPGNPLPDGTYSDARCLSLKELMIITGIDGIWKFPKDSKESFIRSMIGESVPPCIPYEVTKQLKNIDIY
jgi:DNA (cytosine-5)-methyltransferase 1